ncbi:MAG: hypothetical protein FD130_638 [Halothiobacillaceae bacterium]|nr:MAG: hypothetical protein FD130_638 [Halothiobacillaceae bacterium]
MDRYSDFAQAVTEMLLAKELVYLQHHNSETKIQIYSNEHEIATLELTPFQAQPQAVSAAPYFEGVTTTQELLAAYHAARGEQAFEEKIKEAMINVADYASDYLTAILNQAAQELTAAQATRIAHWVKNLDVYTAVKAIESLLNSHADMALLEIAEEQNWQIHFDHLAIRCGSSSHHAAERIVALLTEQHGYTPAHVPGEEFYQFPDGWNAYPLYKILDNGQILRLFIDQSDADAPTQIIQHWNRVYGYTAHHLAMRATRLLASGARAAVPLAEVSAALQTRGVGVLTPTGGYTRGLLLQVFTQPERNPTIPMALKASITAVSPTLERQIENGKLLELVSRQELPTPLAQQLFSLYGLNFDPYNPLHSAPVFNYFLPAQAAHVIKTSLEAG